ncbi:MAG: Tex family protein [Bacteroidales bacterium]
MEPLHIALIASQLSIRPEQVENTLQLLEEGATVPFISRYRKEITGSLDEVQIGDIQQQYQKLLELEKRREAIIRSVQEQGKLTPELESQFRSAQSLPILEDLYLPYKPKRKTRATMARERGLEPLAHRIRKQDGFDPEKEARKYLNNTVPDEKAALQGARDILAETINEDARARQLIRRLFQAEAVISSRVVRGKEPEAVKYDDYYQFSEPLKRCPSHRLMAMRRGADEGLLHLSIAPPEETALAYSLKRFVTASTPAGKQVELAVRDSYKRLIEPSIESEFMAEAKARADEEAIRVFAGNLRQLLLASPLGPKQVLAIDPGFRSGCKLVCLDKQGNLLHNETIYPHPPQNEDTASMRKIASLTEMYNIEAIAIGNGTAGRETEALLQRIRFDRSVQIYVVSENGASVYSASPVAREEFPQYDVTVRGAVSIGRRLMDPLAELVKIDPKSIGVGQYQHDVDQTKLKSSLDSVVESCVNQVGVNVNTASRHLLRYVSGLGPQLAGNLVEFRKEKGPFQSRRELLKVPRMGEKAFEQCAGFLRIPESDNPLDNSAVHPERYELVAEMASDLKVTIPELLASETLRKSIDLDRYLSPQVGMPTLTDIMEELSKPGRDPRTRIEIFSFSSEIHAIEDVKPGMILPGIVTNITNFGCFVDIGVKQDGLVHVSQMADKYVKDPATVVKLHQHVTVKVLETDLIRRRIQLTLKPSSIQPPKP